MRRISRISTLASGLVLASGLASLTGCAGLQRSSGSGYAYRDEDLAFSRDRKSYERNATMSDLGFSDPDALSSADAEAVDLRISLNKAEKALEGKQEREQYFKNKPYMHNDRERLEFLALDSFESRSRWLNAKGIQGGSSQHAPDIQYLIDVNDITLGMTKQAVKDSWGEPDQVEVAGNPLYGNERWHYSEQTSSTEGYQTQHRLVFFESGRVVGWESR